MKKVKLLITSLLLVNSLSSCSINQLFCVHDYQITETKDPTCTEIGLTKKVCNKCGLEVSKTIPKIDHDYIVVKEGTATCESSGYSELECSICHKSKTEKVAALGHDYTKIVTITQPTCSSEGLEYRECGRCGATENVVLAKTEHTYAETNVIEEGVNYLRKECSVCGNVITEVINDYSYINMDLLKYDFKNASTKFSSVDELSLYYSSMLLNQKTKFTAKLNFEYGDLNTLINELENRNDVSTSHSISVKGNDILGFTFEFTYLDSLKKSADITDRYIQLKSANYQSKLTNRSETYDKFTINKSSYSYEVSTSEQLFYVLERFCKPVCVSGSKAEKYYNKLKEICRTTVDDSMSDVLKVKALHDYIVMNVTYDKTLYEKLYNEDSQTMAQYSGFYLEGVLDDNRAVCEGIAKAMTCLLNIEGIPCVMVSASQTKNPNGAGHAYNKVLIDGKWFIVDATSDGTILDNKYELLNYDYFLVDEETMAKKYTGKDFTNLTCNTIYNIFKDSYYKDDKKFSVSSKEELVDLLQYFVDLEEDEITISIFLNYSYSSVPTNEINSAFYNVSGINKYDINYVNSSTRKDSVSIYKIKK